MSERNPPNFADDAFKLYGLLIPPGLTVLAVICGVSSVTPTKASVKDKT